MTIREDLDIDSNSSNDIFRAFENGSINIENNFLTKAKVLSINGNKIVIRITNKFTPVISKNDLKDIKDLKVGSEFDVFVEEVESKKGEIVFSRIKAEVVKKWELLYKSLRNETILEGTVIEKLAGGLNVDIKGISVFLPGSQIETKNIDDYSSYLGKNIEVIVTKINKKNKNVIASHKLVIEKKIREQEQKLFNQIQKGQIVEGIVTTILPYGAVVDIGGISGFLHVKEISWARIINPEEVLKVGQKIKVVVIECDTQTQKLSLGLKYLEPSPWEKINEEDYVVGSIITGKIVNIVDYGAFLEIVPGVEGLIHISDLSWNIQSPKTDSFFKIGETVKAKILEINIAEKKISLGIKQLSEDPWKSEDIDKKMAIGSAHECKVVAMKPFGCIVELENGIYGLLHENDLSWTEKNPKINSFVKINDKIELIVLSFNKEEHKLSLGLKQKTENPWIYSEEIFKIGSIHDGLIVKKNIKGFWVRFENNIEGFVNKIHIPENLKLDVQMTSQFRVVEYDAKNCKMIVVHKDSTKNIDKEFENKSTKITKKTLGDILK